MIQVENNYLNNESFFQIKKNILDQSFVWSISNLNPLNLEHSLVLEKGSYVSSFTPKILSSILKKIEPEVVLESNVRFFTSNEDSENFSYESHFLKNFNYKTFILSLTSCNGCFEITGLNNIESKENQALMFDYKGEFKFTNPTDKGNQIIIELFYQK